MIVDFIVQGFFAVFIALFSVFPDIPAMPTLIVDGWSYFIGFVDNAFGLLVYFLSVPLYIMAIGLIIFMTTFQYIYHFLVRFVVFGIFMRFVGK